MLFPSVPDRTCAHPGGGVNLDCHRFDTPVMSATDPAGECEEAWSISISRMALVFRNPAPTYPNTWEACSWTLLVWPATEMEARNNNALFDPTLRGIVVGNLKQSGWIMWGSILGSFVGVIIMVLGREHSQVSRRRVHDPGNLSGLPICRPCSMIYWFVP